MIEVPNFIEWKLLTVCRTCRVVSLSLFLEVVDEEYRSLAE